MRILGIETSCDETAISIIEVDDTGTSVHVLANVVHSQIDIHASYGGVFPMLAKREHARNLIPALDAALSKSGIFKDMSFHPDMQKTVGMFEREPELGSAFEAYIPSTGRPAIDIISVTHGPGLEPALWVGINFARALSVIWNIPLVAANHMEGHILAALIDLVSEKNGIAQYDLRDKRIMYPALSLLISGGHTQIVLVEKIGSYRIVGDTRDDAVGECFDKVARTLGLSYPGGPKISAYAAEARDRGLQSPEPLPRPMMESGDLDFSFSGLKTAVLYLVKRLTETVPLDTDTIRGICRETEDAITDVLMSKMRIAIERFAVQTIIVGGGVIANTHIRQSLERLADECSIQLLVPEIDHSTDNGLMIALAGYFGREQVLIPGTEITAHGTLPIGPRG